MAIRIGRSKSKYRLQKVPIYDSLETKETFKRTKSKTRVTNVVKKYVKEFDSRFDYRKVDTEAKSSVACSDITSMKSMCQ